MSGTTKSRRLVRTALIALTIHLLIGASAESCEANFIYTPQNPVAGQPVQFTDTSTGNPTAWQWDFGNHPGNPGSHEQNPTWTFDAPGAYAVTLSISAPSFCVSAITKTVVVGVCEPGELGFTSPSYEVPEDIGMAEIPVRRTGGSCGAVSVQCHTADNTATAEDDYEATMDTLTWLDGDTVSKICTVPILDDDFVEDDETVNLSLTNETGGVTLAAPSAAILTILDDIFANGFESGDTCAWSNEVPGPRDCGSLSSAGVVLRVLRDSAIDCGPVQLAPVGESNGSIRLKLPASNLFHLGLSKGDTVILERVDSVRVGEVVEIGGLELAPYELEITTENRPSIRFSIDLNAGNPCAAFEIDP
ncbi:MAG: PKD domain-containing protein [bacterium]|nr:PKD domain-containing protein [bacterium]